jgi:hypothetical protein
LNAFLKIEGIDFGQFLIFVITFDFCFPKNAIFKLGVLPYYNSFDTFSFSKQ